jgi:hypothetical protein
MTVHPVGRRRLVAVGLVVALTFVASAPARAAGGGTHATAPGAGGVIADVVTTSGSGCMAGTTVDLAPDNLSLRVTYSRYAAQVGGSAKPTDIRKNCQLAVRIQIPREFTYAIEKVEYQGSADVASGATAAMRANFYRSGAPTRPWLTRTFRGPFQGPWEAIDSPLPEALVWVSCGATVLHDLNTELRVTKGTSGPETVNVLSMSAGDEDAHSTYHLTWRRCS